MCYQYNNHKSRGLGGEGTQHEGGGIRGGEEQAKRVQLRGGCSSNHNEITYTNSVTKCLAAFHSSKVQPQCIYSSLIKGDAFDSS